MRVFIVVLRDARSPSGFKSNPTLFLEREDALRVARSHSNFFAVQGFSVPYDPTERKLKRYQIPKSKRPPIGE